MCDTTGLSPDVHLKCHIVLVFLEDSGSWCKIQLKNNFLKASFPWAFEMTKKKIWKSRNLEVHVWKTLEAVSAGDLMKCLALQSNHKEKLANTNLTLCPFQLQYRYHTLIKQLHSTVLF